MPSGLADQLFDLLAERQRERIAQGWRETPDWVFCNEMGGRGTLGTWLAFGSGFAVGPLPRGSGS